MDFEKLHAIVKRSQVRKGKILGSIRVCIREFKNNPETINARIVFVEDRSSKSFLAVLSTDTMISDGYILRIYGKRWDIEVFFKMCKSYLALSILLEILRKTLERSPVISEKMTEELIASFSAAAFPLEKQTTVVCVIIFIFQGAY